MIVEIFGEVVGSASGWDQIDSFIVTFYDFIKYEGPHSLSDIDFPTGICLVVNFESGKVYYHMNGDESAIEHHVACFKLAPAKK